MEKATGHYTQQYIYLGVVTRQDIRIFTRSRCLVNKNVATHRRCPSGAVLGRKQKKSS